MAVWSGVLEAARVDISGDVIAFQTSKRLGQPAGTWSLTLLPRTAGGSSLGDVRRAADLYSQLRPNQLVSIGYDEPGGIMLGLIDRIDRELTAVGDSATLSLVIRGRDLGKALVADNIVRATVTTVDAIEFKARVEAVLGKDHPLTIDVLGVWGPTNPEGVPTFIGASVQDVIDFTLRRAGSMQIPVLAKATGGSGIPADYISTDFSVTTWNDGRIWSDGPVTQEGNLWSFLGSVLDADFYEIWLDSIPNGSSLPNAQLIVRPRPFDEPDLDFAVVSDSTGLEWQDLKTMVNEEPYHDIPLDRVIRASLGVSDADAYAYYLVTAQHELIGNPDGLKEGLIYPLVDLYAARTFGTRAYRAALSLVAGDLTVKAAGDVDYDGDVHDAIHDARNRLLNWYRLNPYFETGSITVVGADVFRVGDPVHLPWATPQFGSEAGMTYYCTGVTQAWEFGKPYTTTLELTRGHNAAMVREVKALIRAEGAFVSPPNLEMLAET